MARPALFTDDDVLDAALACVMRDGRSTTIAAVAAELGGPVGSIYHRVRSRDELLIRLWLRSVGRFQRRLLELAEGADPQAALLACAAHVPAYCRAHRAEAVALTLYRQADLIDDSPVGLEDAVAGVNADLQRVTARLARRRFGNGRERGVRLVVLATRVAPYGLVRPHLGGPVPTMVDDAVAAAARAILALGDR